MHEFVSIGLYQLCQGALLRLRQRTDPHLSPREGVSPAGVVGGGGDRPEVGCGRESDEPMAPIKSVGYLPDSGHGSGIGLVVPWTVADAHVRLPVVRPW